MRIPRHLPNIVIIGQAVLSVALAIGIIVLALSNGSISRSNSGLIAANTELISAVHTSNITACAADNQDRAESKVIVEMILGLPTMTPQSILPKLAAEQAVEIKNISAAASAAYAARNCALLYPDPKKG